jgi:hypothetical protein
MYATEVLQLRDEIRRLEALLERKDHPLTVSSFASAIYSPFNIVRNNILQLHGDVNWLDASGRGSSLFVRDCYEKLWEIVSAESQTRRRFTICCNPGIGKSWFLFYVMYRLGIEQNPMVYAQTIGTLMHFMLIQPPNVVQHSDAILSQEMNEVLGNSSAWYLVDGPVNVASLFRINARVLQVTSPDRKNFKDFLEAHANQYFMPVWTHDELEDCRQKMYPSVRADNLTELERIADSILAFAVGVMDANDAKVTYPGMQIEVDPTTFMHAHVADMSITHEGALQALYAMFSSWERESINAAFENNDYDIERTIEAILAMNQAESAALTRCKGQGRAVLVHSMNCFCVV